MAYAFLKMENFCFTVTPRPYLAAIPYRITKSSFIPTDAINLKHTALKIRKSKRTSPAFGLWDLKREIILSSSIKIPLSVSSIRMRIASAIPIPPHVHDLQKILPCFFNHKKLKAFTHSILPTAPDTMMLYSYTIKYMNYTMILSD